MKAKIRIPKDQFAFIEVETEGTKEEIEAVYDSFGGADYERIQKSLKNLDFNKTVDKYLLTNTLEADEYAELDIYQKLNIQVIKRAFKRIKNNEV